MIRLRISLRIPGKIEETNDSHDREYSKAFALGIKVRIPGTAETIDNSLIECTRILLSDAGILTPSKILISSAYSIHCRSELQE
jgi:hypothetical protein